MGGRSAYLFYWVYMTSPPRSLIHRMFGMSATAEIKTGDRPMYDFILSPIAKRTKEAARER